jgi:hypothetical protein
MGALQIFMPQQNVFLLVSLLVFKAWQMMAVVFLRCLEVCSAAAAVVCVCLRSSPAGQSEFWRHRPQQKILVPRILASLL